MPLLAGIGPLGLPELGLILVIVLLIFGAGRLPDVGGAIGRSVREFRKASKDDDGDAGASATTNNASSSADAAATTPDAARVATTPDEDRPAAADASAT